MNYAVGFQQGVPGADLVGLPVDGEGKAPAGHIGDLGVGMAVGGAHGALLKVIFHAHELAVVGQHPAGDARPGVLGQGVFMEDPALVLLGEHRLTSLQRLFEVLGIGGPDGGRVDLIAVEVLLHQQPGGFGVPAGDGGGNLLVVLDDFQVFHRREGHAAHPVKVDGDVFHQGVNLGLLGDLKQDAVKLVVQVHELAGIEIFQVEVLKPDVLVQPFQVQGGGHLTVQLHHGALQKIAHEAGLVHHVIVDEGDGAFFLGLYVHDFHLGQLDEGLPHGGAGQAHLGGQLVFADLAAGGELQVDDVFLDGAQGVVSAGFPGKTL